MTERTSRAMVLFPLIRPPRHSDVTFDASGVDHLEAGLTLDAPNVHPP